VQWSARQREPEDKTAGAILVVWIVIHDLPICKGFTDLLDADVPNDALINRVFRELELTVCDLVAQLSDHRYSMARCGSLISIIALGARESNPALSLIRLSKQNDGEALMPCTPRLTGVVMARYNGNGPTLP